LPQRQVDVPGCCANALVSAQAPMAIALATMVRCMPCMLLLLSLVVDIVLLSLLLRALSALPAMNAG
jgi:hypothetical protein